MSLRPDFHSSTSPATLEIPDGSLASGSISTSRGVIENFWEFSRWNGTPFQKHDFVACARARAREERGERRYGNDAN